MRQIYAMHKPKHEKLKSGAMPDSSKRHGEQNWDYHERTESAERLTVAIGRSRAPHEVGGG